MCLAHIFAANSIGFSSLLPISVFAKCVSGPHVFCDKFIGVHDSSEKGIDGSRSSVEFSCGVY